MIKNKIIILLLIFICYNCNDDRSIKNNIQGNWSYVSKDSLYFEIKIDSEYIQYYYYNIGFLPSEDYIFKEDSIIIGYNSNNYTEDDVYFCDCSDSLEIFFKNKFEREMRFYRIDSKELTFDKISDFNSEDDMLRFEVAHLNRKNKLFGVNYIHNYDSIVKTFKEMKRPETLSAPEPPKIEKRK